MTQNETLLSGDHAGKTILIVDDTSENLQVIGGLLQPHYRVLIASNGERAIRIAHLKPQPDLILLDIMMPELDGYGVLASLRADRDTADIPVIFVSALGSDDDEARGLTLGAVDYIAKPVVPALLLARVRTQLELKDARDWLRDRNATLAREVARQTREVVAAKEEAEAASQAKSRFINCMSHELRTPMNDIAGMLQLARMGSPPDAAIQEQLSTALEGTRRVMELLEAILEFSALDKGHLEVEARVFDPAGMLRAMESHWRRRAEQAGLLFLLKIIEGAPDSFAGDEAHLVRILTILLDNAIRFTAAGEVELGIAAQGGGLHLWVRDTGCGIAKDAQARIFEPFEQEDGSRTRPHSGSGLGLAIAQRLASLMRGNLLLDSRPGKGSTFHVILPVHGSDLPS
jgi:two-component system sensor histidine kinase/response regulator